MKARAVLALLSLLALLAGISVASPGASAAPVAITDGTLAWGIKASWRQYAGNGVQSGGVAQDANGIYQFPIESGSYDPETRTTTIQAKGTIHWQSHWYPDEAFYPPPVGYTGPLDIHVLDVTIKDPRLTISAAGSVISVEAISRKVSTWELIDLGRTDFAELDPIGVTPTVAGGTTSWAGIPTALTETGAQGVFGGNYPVGQVLDQASFSYSGEGGAPDFGEHWTAPDSNGLELGKNGTFGDLSTVVPFLVDANRKIIHTQIAGNLESTLQAFDLTTGEFVGTQLTFDNLELYSRGGAFVDPTTATTYYSSARTTTIDSSFRWNPETENYETGSITPIEVPHGNSLWDAKGERWLRISRVVPAGIEASNYEAHEWWLSAYELSDAGDSIEETRYRLPNAPTGWNESWYNKTMASAAGAADGSIILPRTGPFIPQAGVTAAPLTEVGVQRIVLDEATKTATVTELPGSQTTLQLLNEVKQYDRALANENGDIAIAYTGIGPTRPSRLRQYEMSDGGGLTQVGDQVSLTQVKNTAFTIGPDGTVWQNDNRGQRLVGVRDGRVVLERKIPFINTRTLGIGTLADGSLWIQTSDGTPADFDSSVYGWARFVPTGYSPVIGTQPASASVTVDPAGSKAVSFTTAATGTPAPTLRWQRRAPGSGKFVDVAGATGTTLEVDATAADNGAAYRAVATNAAGELATEVAELEVRFAPTISFDVADRGALEGEDATFDLLATGNPEPQVTWQRRVGGFWEAVDPDLGDFVVAGNKLTVKEANLEMDGALFRAKVANAVGTTYSRTAKLSVKSAVAEPVTFGSGLLEWGFANRWRCYVTGIIAQGGIELSGGVTRVPGTEATGSLCPGAGESSQALSFPVRGGKYDPADGSLEVKMNGSVRFWGHAHHTPGSTTPQLDTTFSNLRLVAAGETGTLYADATGATMENPTPVTRTNVPLVSVDLAETGPTPNAEIGLDWSGAETELTAEGAEIFGSYPEGEPFDPLAMSLEFGTPQPDPEPEGGSKPPLPGPTPPQPKGPAAKIAVPKGAQPLAGNRTAKLGTLSCPAVAPCMVLAPERVRAKIGGKRFGLRVLAPKWIAAGKSVTLRAKLPEGAAERLAGETASVSVKVSVLANGNVTEQVLRVVVAGR